MSTSTRPGRQCIDCASYGVATPSAGKSPRCYAHSNLRRAWSRARSKARGRGAADYRDYDPTVLVARQVLLTRARVIELDKLQRAIAVATADITGVLQDWSEPLHVLGASQHRLGMIVGELKAAAGIDGVAGR